MERCFVHIDYEWLDHKKVRVVLCFYFLLIWFEQTSGADVCCT